MIKLFINGNEIEISQDSLKGFSATYQAADIETIQDRSASYTKTVTAPLTDNNKLHLGLSLIHI